MKLSDLQPLEKVLVCKHALENPDWMVNVDHRDAGELDCMCNHDHKIDDMTWICAAHLGVIFPQIRELEEVPLGHSAAYRDGEWTLIALPYEDGDSPGELPPPPDESLGPSGWSYTCACCGETKTGLPELAFKGPVQSLDAEGDPNYEILEHTRDLCRIRIEGTEHYWIRALLPISIPAARATYSFGVWSTISGENFKRYRERFDGEQRDLDAMFGYLSNAVPGVPNSVGMVSRIVPSEPGRRPWLLLTEPDGPHPLFEAQQDGVTVDTLISWIADQLRCDGSG